MPRDPKMESLSAKCTQPPFWQVSSANERTQPERNDYSAQYIRYTTIRNQRVKSKQLSEQLYTLDPFFLKGQKINNLILIVGFPKATGSHHWMQGWKLLTCAKLWMLVMFQTCLTKQYPKNKKSKYNVNYFKYNSNILTDTNNARVQTFPTTTLPYQQNQTNPIIWYSHNVKMIIYTILLFFGAFYYRHKVYARCQVLSPRCRDSLWGARSLQRWSNSQATWEHYVEGVLCFLLVDGCGEISELPGWKSPKGFQGCSCFFCVWYVYHSQISSRSRGSLMSEEKG